jgi:hypothetical protein
VLAPLLQAKLYGAIPPATVEVIAPFVLLAQVGFVGVSDNWMLLW